MVSLAFAAISGCSDSLDRPIVFVLPDGFHGPFATVLGSPSQPIVDTDEAYEVHIPESGVIWLSQEDFDLFATWHESSYRTESGESIDSLGQDGISGTDGHARYMIGFIGSKEEASKFFHGEGEEFNSWLTEQGICE